MNKYQKNPKRLTSCPFIHDETDTEVIYDIHTARHIVTENDNIDFQHFRKNLIATLSYKVL